MKYKDIGKGRFYNGDCFEVMAEIPSSSIDMILCDLPYGTTSCKWDVILPFEMLWQEYWRICKPNAVVILTSSQPFTSLLICSQLKYYKHEIIWFKNVPTGMAQASYAPMKYHETIQVFCKEKISVFNKQYEEREGIGKDCYNYEHYCGDSNHVKMKKVKKFYDPKLVNPSSVLLFNTVPNREGKIHPTQKPVALFEYLIKTYSNEESLILDNCAGSGTTAIASENTNRKWICIEKEENYYNKSIERIEDNLKHSDDGILWLE
jgi:site-specific DNA-methyltransferase (adenine-specific)